MNHDFGAICKEDHHANMTAIQDGGRVFSLYLIPGNEVCKTNCTEYAICNWPIE